MPCVYQRHVDIIIAHTFHSRPSPAGPDGPSTWYDVTPSPTLHTFSRSIDAGDVAAGTTRVGVGRTAAGVRGHPRVQHRHGRALRSQRLRELVCGLDRPTVCGLIVDDDRGSRVELVPDLRDFARERDLVETVVS